MIKNIGNFKDFKDGTVKCVYDVGGYKIIEMSVLYNKEDKDVICVPTHHFCNLGCKMCHLTNKGLNKAMIPICNEDFMYCITETLKNFKTDKKKLLISFMGVGEPLLNIKLIQDVFMFKNQILDLGYEDISYAISTMMPNKNLVKLTQMANDLNIPIKVHFSLHTPINQKRKKLIPSTNVDIEEALEMLKLYRNTVTHNNTIMQNYTKFHRTTDPVEIHYTLIKDINDSDVELQSLIELLQKFNITIKFIKFNPINSLNISKNEEKWIETIKKEIPNLRVKQYCPPGREVGSSCGEFTKHYYHYEIETVEELAEFEEWKRKHQIV